MLFRSRTKVPKLIRALVPCAFYGFFIGLTCGNQAKFPLKTLVINYIGESMKAQFISALVTTLILGTTGSISQAQIPSRPPAPVQMQNGVPNVPGMNFTDEQKEELRELQKEARSRMSEILTSDQIDDLQAAMEEGSNPREVVKSLNLSRREIRRLQVIKKWQREELANILTDEQNEKLEQIRQRQGRQGRRVGGYRLNIR